MMEKIDPWGKMDVEDYSKLSREFGIGKFEDFAKKLPERHLFMRRGVIFGQRDFSRIFDCIVHKKPFVAMTGLMPSGRMHIGNAMVAEQMIYYQNQGAHIYLCVADIEAYNMRQLSAKELRKNAIEEYLLNYIAMGLKTKNCDFYFQSDRCRDMKKSNAYYRLIGMLPKRVTFNEMEAIYGKLSPGKIISVITQVADILHPQLAEYGGPKPIVVPVGVDQDPHIRLTRDLADRFTRNKDYDFILPSSTYNEFMKGLKGGKMSSSDPTSYIALTDTPEQAKEKIMKYAFSGGRGSVQEHREKGGVPEVDVSYQMLYMMFEPDDKKIRQIHDDYKSGKMLTGELKQILIEKLEKFLAEHAEKREKAKDKMREFLQTTS